MLERGICTKVVREEIVSERFDFDDCSKYSWPGWLGQCVFGSKSNRVESSRVELSS